MKYHEVYHHRNETMVSVYHQGQGRTGHRLFILLFQNLMLCACLLLLLLLAATTVHAQTVLNISGATTSTWTAPESGGPYFVRITARGADGGIYYTYFEPRQLLPAGQGAKLSGIFRVEAGQTIRAISGARGSNGDPDFEYGAGGGGGAGAVNASSNTLLLLSGGGTGGRLDHRSSGASISPGDGSGGIRCIVGNGGAGGGGLNGPGVDYNSQALGGGQVSFTGLSGGGQGKWGGGSGMGGGGGGYNQYPGGGGGQTGGNCNGPAASQPGGECQSNTAGGGTSDPQDGYVTIELLTTQAYYRDADGDSYGDAGNITTGAAGCTPEGYVSDNTDCNDGSVTVNPTTIWVLDSDNDGHYTGDRVRGCAPGEGYVVKSSQQAGDCNDADNSVWRTGTFFRDGDGDSFTVGNGEPLCYGQNTPTGYTQTKSSTEDCDDADNTKWQTGTFYTDGDGDGYTVGNSVMVCYGAIVPAGYAATKSATDDCNDDDATKHSSFSFYADGDGDGYGAGKAVSICAVDAATPPPGYSTSNTDCAPTDNTKWQSATLYVDADGDGYTTGNSTTVCYGTTVPAGYSASRSTSDDCDDGDNTKWRSAILFADGDGDGYTTGTGMTMCYGSNVPAGYRTTTLGSDCDDTKASVHPGAPEICGNGIDDNCNEQVDENCGPCANGTNLTTSNITSSSAQLNWKAPATPVQCQVQYKSLATGSKWKTVTVSGTARSMTLMGLQANQRYKWQLQAKCGKLWTSWSYEVEFTTLTTSGVTTMAKSSVTKQSVDAQETVVVPNLLHRSQLWRIPNLPAHNKIVVADGNGRTVLQAANYANNKGFTNAAAGLYFYQIITTEANGQSKTYTGKLLILD